MPLPHVQPVELPAIDPPYPPMPNGRDRDKEHLERKKLEHERELARLRVLARAQGIRQ